MQNQHDRKQRGVLVRKCEQEEKKTLKVRVCLNSDEFVLNRTDQSLNEY